MEALSTILDPVRAELDEMEVCIELIRKDSSNNLSKILDCSLQNGGKRIRPVLTFLSGKFYGKDLRHLIPMAASVELLHTATLVHDDMIDKSAIRHGRPTVNEIWGENKALILGDYLFAKSGELCASTSNVRVMQLFCQTLGLMSLGEMNQAFDAFSLKVTREQYLDRICKKTASLFVLATESGAILSQAPEESTKILRDYGYNLGMAFQIVDDLLDFLSTEDELGKPVGSDLSQGTITLPVILLLERHSEDRLVLQYFENRGDFETKERVLESIRIPPIIQECYDIAMHYRIKACRNLSLLPNSVSHQALMDIANYVVERKK
ncbi:polyprenyl synthetase family protein [Dehalococcoides mccartyi]|uniref:Polyprenyl synthetase family protein n=1 Tax=Dehalococcoides mccartyi TaxID=61435 RepID=A0AB38Z811_9CHLR|nr:polyprenyl synthetase family protein [Dehalococcoides mccartyi]WRO06692.1 polyprenyl synthetase family protein [Dehalococcoides mccartyi]